MNSTLFIALLKHHQARELPAFIDLMPEKAKHQKKEVCIIEERGVTGTRPEAPICFTNFPQGNWEIIRDTSYQCP